MAGYAFPEGLRVLVAGSSTSTRVRAFARELGRALIAPGGGRRVVVTGGNADKVEADVVAGVRSTATGVARGDLLPCVSFLTRQHAAQAVLQPGFEGTVAIVARGSSRQARRFEMVREVDVIVTLGGARSIPTMITLAEALGLPVLPLPFTGGASRDAWDRTKREWRESDDDATSDPTEPGSTLHPLRRHEAGIDSWDLDADPAALARCVVEVVDDVGRRGCFVAMPYDPASVARYHPLVARAIDAAGLRLIDARESLESGLVIDEVKRHIQSSRVVLAVLSDQRRLRATSDDLIVSVPSSGTSSDEAAHLPQPLAPTGRHAEAFNPNVMYEVGFAHALGVPTVLLTDAETGLPFDVQGYRAVVIAADPSGDGGVGPAGLAAELAERLRYAAGV